MTEKNITKKREFENALTDFVDTLQKYISTPDGQWTIKGFIDVYKNIGGVSKSMLIKT